MAPVQAQSDGELRVSAWRRLIDTNQGESELRKLALANNFFNQVAFVDDIIHWRKDDYWATPLETLMTNGGDCEDFVIGKYFTLKYLNVSDDKMRLTHVKALTLNKAHMVLAYYETPTAEPLLLDNLDREIKRASQRRDLVPVYSFNLAGIWIPQEKGSGQYVREATSMSLWKELLDRIDREPNHGR